jgi:hypothetical protein
MMTRILIIPKMETAMTSGPGAHANDYQLACKTGTLVLTICLLLYLNCHDLVRGYKTRKRQERLYEALR